MSKHFFILIAFFTLILAACNPTNSNQNNQAEITVDIVASEDPIPVVANGQKIALWAKSSPPDAKFFWSLEGKGEIENDTSEAIFYIAPSKLEKDEQVVVLVEITDKDGNTAEDRQIIQLIPATPTPTPKPTDTPTPTITPSPTNTPTPTITPSPTETPTPHPTPTATPEPCTMPSVHLPLNLSSSISAEFTDPVDCAIIIEPGFLVSGTYTGDLANKKIWGFVIPERDLRYYVQSPNACEGLSANTSKNESGGSWNTLASLGGPPQKYGIAVFVAEAEGETSTILSDHLDNSCKINSLRGFTREEMEEFDLIEIGSITVEKIEESND